MNIELILMSEYDIVEFKKNIQYAFQKGFEDVYGKCEETILPELVLHILKNVTSIFMLMFVGSISQNFSMRNTLCRTHRRILSEMEMKVCLHSRK